MRKGIIFITVLLLVISACRNKDVSIMSEQVDRNQELYYQNFAKENPQEPDELVLMHNRMGIRIEYNISDQKLSLWFSPYAGKSLDYRDRNFSSRDDHTSIFEQIYFPELTANNFLKCDYGAFHSVLHFKENVLHIVSLYSDPAVLIWFENSAKVDIKSHAGDKIRERSKAVFFAEHFERGILLNYAAALGTGNGSFSHQKETDIRRSTFARASLSEHQTIVFAATSAYENVQELSQKLSDRSIELLLAMNDERAGKELKNGRIHLKNSPVMQEVLEENRKIILSMQDVSGAMRTSPKYIYYLLWNRDQCMTTAMLSEAGWHEPLRLNNRFILYNPNRSMNDDPKGRFFGQLTGGPITKWEEDAIFYVVWAAFNYWTQTGDKIYCSNQNFALLSEAIDWVEEYCYDEEIGLFGRYHYSETPFTGSRGDGWDNANGRPSPVNIVTTFGGDTIVRSYDIYINRLMASTYWMMHAMTEPFAQDSFKIKALALENELEQFNRKASEFPYSGLLKTISGENKRIEPFGMDSTDYLYALSLPVFNDDFVESPFHYNPSLLTVLDHNRMVLSGYFSVLHSIDNQFVDEDEVMGRIMALQGEIIRPGKFLPMSFTIPEGKGFEDGHPFRDIRPVTKSIASCYAATANLGVRKFPFGIAVRPTKYIEQIENYNYLGKNIHFSWYKQGKIAKVIVNSKKLVGTYQIPSKWLLEDNEVVVEMSEEPVETLPVLVSSTVHLHHVENGASKINYEIECFGKSILIFKNVSPKAISIQNPFGETIDFSIDEHSGFTRVIFIDKGLFTVVVSK